jgi:YggT family protein
MQEAFAFLVDTLFSLLFFVFLLRLLLQWVRADFRNPLCQAVVQITNPLIMPLRRILPPVSRIDTASVVAVVAVSVARTAASAAAHGLGLLSVPTLLRLTVLEMARSLLQIYFWFLLVYTVLSWVAPGVRTPAGSILNALCEPLLQPLRRIIPPLAGLDLSGLVAMVAIQFLLLLLH